MPISLPEFFKRLKQRNPNLDQLTTALKEAALENPVLLEGQFLHSADWAYPLAKKVADPILIRGVDRRTLYPASPTADSASYSLLRTAATGFTK